MIVVDSNAWAGYFNGEPTPYVERLERALLEEEDIAVIPVIIAEVLQGFRSDSGFRRAQRIVVALPVIHPDVACHVRAAALFRRLRSKGVTVRGGVDCIIAQSCLEAGAQLLSPDSDFRQIARHTPLDLWRADRR